LGWQGFVLQQNPAGSAREVNRFRKPQRPQMLVKQGRPQWKQPAETMTRMLSTKGI